jgi:Polyketide cyclase / dehydrase and lipid transport
MASLRREIWLERTPDEVWEAIRDVGAVHERLTRGFVLDTTMEAGPAARVVTFANGAVVRELIVDVDDDRRRVAYAAVEGPLGLTHHNASFEVVGGPDGRTLLVWITDLLPDDVAPTVEGMMDQGVAAMLRTLDGAGVSGGVG